MNSPAAIPAGPSSISEEVRAQFEASDRETSALAPGYYSTSNGRYVDLLVQCRWETWQAATALSAARIRELEEALTLIAETDPVDAALDPQRAVRAARSTLKEGQRRG